MSDEPWFRSDFAANSQTSQSQLCSWDDILHQLIQDRDVRQLLQFFREEDVEMGTTEGYLIVKKPK